MSCLDADGPVELQLPNQWLWNVIDEFIYQFQSFSQFRSKLSKKVTNILLILSLSYKFVVIKGDLIVKYKFGLRELPALLIIDQVICEQGGYCTVTLLSK